ncbi:MAG TPA: energy transducer TonB, partial [Methylomirabilota bacterium]|nr:energy transducer TonB [Methylomirabilota bacterium]
MILALATGPLAPALQAVGWALLHLVWQGTAIAAALVLLLALLPSRSASLRYALSCGAMLLLVVVAALTGWRSYRADTPTPRPASHAVRQQAAPVGISAPAPAPSVAAIVVATFAPARVPSLPDPWRAASDALPAVVSLWLAGVTVLSLRLIVQWLRARRLATENAQPACEPWLAMARRLSVALGVRRAVRLLESTAVQVPAVVGLVRPV